MKKVAHLTTVHQRYDTRIFIKEIKSLASYYIVSLIVADGRGDEFDDDISIFDVGKPINRIQRLLLYPKKVLQKAILLDVDIYHLHDPELLSVGLKLKKLGKKVVYDAHEDVVLQIQNKPYIWIYFRIFISQIFGVYQKYICRNFDLIITATSSIKDRYKRINKMSIDINNYPKLEEFIELSSNKDENIICYIGGLNKSRGIIELVEALEFIPDVKLLLAGSFLDGLKECDLESLKGWDKVQYLGHINRQGIRDVLLKSKIGIVTLHPIQNYLESLPVKMFEYMAAGIPVIASNFPLWQKIIRANNCGICVDPKNPKRIAQVINHMLNNPKEAMILGKNGREAVKERYNWSLEVPKLIDSYNQLLS